MSEIGLQEDMNHKILDKNSQEEVANLFTSVFTASEGEKEGRLIGSLASKLSSGIDNREIFCFGTYEEESIIGSVFFTRLRFNGAIQVYMLAPVAVSTNHQGKGVGQARYRLAPSPLPGRPARLAGGSQSGQS